MAEAQRARRAEVRSEARRSVLPVTRNRVQAGPRSVHIKSLSVDALQEKHALFFLPDAGKLR